MQLAALVSGGKDSVLALYKAQQMGHEIKVLGTMVPKRSDSYMFHYPNIHITDYLAEALEIPLVKAKTSGIKEKELEDLKKLIASLDVDGLVTGAIASVYQKKRIDNICDELGLKSIAPLWHQEPLGLMNELVSLRFKVIIVGVSAQGLDQTWLGQEINQETLQKFVELNKKYQISLVGEGGEYESLVLDGPIYKKSIEIVESEIDYKNDSGVLIIKKAKLVDKS
ncbi:MAG: TIGR00289 family protein [Candidatus Bathyarchaeota archaeon]|nr:MAG: TIGR00289 family protein [Candidatus Bathyarchaeum tardum]WNZ29334.1 MAG: TIGR00289 family protein [Candidatus Bathyarchaeota archaeon]